MFTGATSRHFSLIVAFRINHASQSSGKREQLGQLQQLYSYLKLIGSLKYNSSGGSYDVPRSEMKGVLPGGFYSALHDTSEGTNEVLWAQIS